MDNRQNLHGGGKFPVSHDVRITNDDQFARAGQPAGSANGRVVLQKLCIIAYGFDDPSRRCRIVAGDLIVNAAQVIGRRL
jgi:hypothetical protein